MEQKVLRIKFQPDRAKAYLAEFSHDGTLFICGYGETPEAAILDLASQIRMEQVKKSFGSRVVNQVITNEQVAETVATLEKIINVGKIVHYMPGSDDTEQAGQILPAIITREWGGGKMDLQVFNNKVSGTSSRYSVEHSMSANAGTWDWPKKA